MTKLNKQNTVNKVMDNLTTEYILDYKYVLEPRQNVRLFQNEKYMTLSSKKIKNSFLELEDCVKYILTIRNYVNGNESYVVVFNNSIDFKSKQGDLVVKVGDGIDIIA